LAAQPQASGKGRVGETEANDAKLMEKAYCTYCVDWQGASEQMCSVDNPSVGEGGCVWARESPAGGICVRGWTGNVCESL